MGTCSGRPSDAASHELAAAGLLLSAADWALLRGRGVNSTIIQPTMSHLDFIRKILYKIQPNQFHTVLLYNRGTEPQIILFYHPDEVQVPQVPRM